MVTLNLMHEDINKVTDKPYQAYPPDSKVLGVTEAARQTWEMYESREQSPIVDILHGMYQAERICQRCNNYYYKFDTFSSLPIEIKKPGGKPSTGFISLEDCLEADREPTIINEFYCRTCQDFVDAKSTLELYQLPPILVLQFKRFRENQWGGFEKVRFPVSYPLEIDMAKY